jgi:hypothetical protein
VVDFPARSTGSCLGDAVSRRSLITGAAGVAALVLTGCSAGDSTSPEEAPQPPAELAPDVAVATRALAEIRAVSAAVGSTVRRHPATRSALAPLGQMHAAHEASLADAVPDRASTTATPAPYVVPRRREVALRAVTTREQRLHATLDALALRAQSGDFARLLASMGAAIGQQLAVGQP